MTDLQKALNVDSCDPKSLREKLDDIFKDFTKEVRDTIFELANNFLGPFIVTFVTLMGQLAAVNVANLASMLISAVGAGIVGSLLGLVNLSLSLVNGIRIMLKYLAVKALREFLNDRSRYIRALRADIDGFLSLLRALQSLGIEAENIFTDDIERALPHVRAAARIIGKENAKITTSSGLALNVMDTNEGIDNEQLDKAVIEISRAISDLSGGGVDPLFQERISKINEKYGIKVNLGDISGNIRNIPGGDLDIPNPVGIIQYFQDAVDELRKKGDMELVQNYILEFLSDHAVSSFLRDYASTLFMKSRIDSLGKRLPVRSYIAAHYGKKAAGRLLDEAGAGRVNDAIANAQDWQQDAKNDIEKAFEYLDIHPNKPIVEYPNTGFTTFAANSEAIKSAQAAVLLQDDWMNLIEAESSVVKTFLTPALNKVLRVKLEMEQMKDSPLDDEAPKEKVRWVGELAMAKTFVQTVTEPEIGFSSGQRMSGREIQNRFKDALEGYDRLTDQIIERVVDENLQPKESDSDKLLDIADQYLSSFFLGPIAMFNPNARTNVIAGLQSIRVLLASIQQQDEVEIRLCDRFIYSIESNPIFNSVIKPSWEAFINSLGNVPVLSGLAGSLKNGDLSRVVNAAGTAKYALDEFADLTECMSKRSDLENNAEALSNATGTSKDKVLAVMEEHRNTVTSLKAKKQKIESVESSIQRLLN